MRIAKQVVTAGSRNVVYPSVLGRVISTGLFVGTALAATGCFIVGGGYNSSGDPPNDPPVLDDPMTVQITSDATLIVQGGDGVGVFVESRADGSWHVYASCDTNTSGFACDFTGKITSDANVSDVQPDSLEAADSTSLENDQTVSFRLDTSTDLDGFTFATDVGAEIELEFFLDGHSTPEYVFWMGGGVLHTGAPTNPVRFDPE